MVSHRFRGGYNSQDDRDEREDREVRHALPDGTDSILGLVRLARACHVSRNGLVTVTSLPRNHPGLVRHITNPGTVEREHVAAL